MFEGILNTTILDYARAAPTGAGIYDVETQHNSKGYDNSHRKTNMTPPTLVS